MKSLFIKINFIVCFIFFNLSSYAQVFDTLYVIPSQANTDDSISVISKIYFGKTPCPLDSFSIVIIDSTISIDALYTLGFGSGSCLSHDTIMIGKLDPKLYKLIYNAIDLRHSLSNKDSINFNVVQVVGVSERNNPIQSVSIFPNPSKEEINLKLQLSKAVSATIRITDAQGKIVHTNQLQLFKGESTHTIATANISSGVYSLSLWEGEKLLKEEKLIVQH